MGVLVVRRGGGGALLGIDRRKNERRAVPSGALQQGITDTREKLPARPNSRIDELLPLQEPV